MGEWDFLGGLIETMQGRSPLLGRFWLLLMLVFRIVILGTVAEDMFEDEQEEFTCNTAQPGCEQMCYDQAFPISQYRFWVFHIVLIATPSLLFLMYATHQQNKSDSESRFGKKRDGDGRRFRTFYLLNVAFRLLAEVGFVVGQWWLYGFAVKDHFKCSRFPCPHTVDCFTSRPSEKTIFLYFYFIVGVVSACASLVEFWHSAIKWFCFSRRREPPCACGHCPDDHWVDVEDEGMELKKQKTKAAAAQRSSKPKRGHAKRQKSHECKCAKKSMA